MLNGIYHILIVIVAVLAVIYGYRQGFMRQTGVLLGVGFGIVFARLLSPDCLQTVDGWVPASFNGFNRSFLVLTLTNSGIYLIVAVVVSVASLPLSKLTDALGTGLLNSICGAVFKLFQYLMLLSIFYNVLVDINPQGSLTRSSGLHDGNIVEGVMKIAPAILGFPDGEEVGYRQQLEDAKAISV